MPKKIKKKVVPWERYPHIPLLMSNARLRRSLLGKRLQWTIKEDGENVSIWLRAKKYAKNSSSLYTGMVSLPKGFEIVVSSHNQENALGDIVGRVQRTKEFSNIIKLIVDNPTYRITVEECRKGLSITRIKEYPRSMLYVIDIFDVAIENFLPYTLVYQTCFHYGIPVVKLYAETRHRTMKDLLKFKNHVLEYCECMKEEGMVLRTFDDIGDYKNENGGNYLQAKVKLDTPEPLVRKVQEGQPVYPQIPESEIMGAISHVEADFGLDGTPSHDMPLIAKAVSEECRKHLYAGRGNLFGFYQEYMENRKQ